MNNETCREELARRESEFLNSLLGISTEASNSFDTAQLDACANLLKSKRARVIDRLLGRGTECSDMPDLNKEAYFTAYPSPHADGPLADTERYRRFLSRKRWKDRFKAIGF